MILLAALLAAAPVDPHQAAQNAEIAMMTCFHRQAAALDDHISDASTIARAVVSMCHPQFDNWKYANYAELQPLAATLFYKRMEESATNIAIEIVLWVRTAPKHR